MAKNRANHRQVELVFRTHGGKRPGAGRKPKGPRAAASHRTRPEHDLHHPVHVTLRLVGSAPGLRCKDMYLAVREATIAIAKRRKSSGCPVLTDGSGLEERPNFRITHMSIQRDHIHLIVEADSTAALSSGMRGFSISAAKQINKAFTARGGDRRTGRVIADRYHARPLTSPRAVRNTLSYALNNWRHHGEDQAPSAHTWKVDPYSSGALFPGWRELEGSPFFWPLPAKYLPLIVFRPQTWLLRNWHKFHPLISVWEVPGHH